MLILSENGYAISSKTALTLKRSVKGGVAEPNDHHKVMNWQNCRSNYVWEYKKPYPPLNSEAVTSPMSDSLHHQKQINHR